jgi:surface polysaccharide O-acyltransferase-like enzyme
MENRVFYLDKLRSATILGVVVFHSAVGYSGAALFWPFRGEEIGRGFDLALYLADIVMMPLLFFIAGYFALPSYRRRGGKGFLLPKLRRLGIPWLAVSFALLPLLDYLHYRTRLSGSLGIGQYLLLSWRRICTPYLGFLDMGTFIPLIDQYYQRYMWFISLLLFMYAAFPLAYRLKERLGRGKRVGTKAGVAVLFAAAFALAFLALGVLRTGMNWFSLANVLQFQPVKLAYYLALFWFGVFCGERGLLAGSGLFRRSWPLGLVSLLLLAPAFIFGMILSRSQSPQLWAKFLYALAYSAITVSSTLFVLNLGQGRWNRPSRFWSWLSGISFEVYLVHYAFVLTVPLAFRQAQGMPPFLKFVCVALASVGLSILAAMGLRALEAGIGKLRRR